MRFLKTKIMKAQKAVDKSLAPTITPENDMEDISTTTDSPLQKSPTASDANAGVQIANKISKSRQKQSFGQKRQSHKRVPGGNSRATKNVVINFGKAIASFAGSPLANMYLKPMLEKENVTTKEFTDFVGQAKSGIGGIDSFRLLLLIEKGDTDTLAACKRVFAEIGKVFIKYFSVNWITHGRINDKLTHLKYRNRMLRRIENPENFTYVCGSRKQ